jgi:serine protease AprX
MAVIGPLLRNAIIRMQEDVSEGVLASAAHIGFDPDEAKLPLVLKSETLPPREGESWEEYKGRVAPHLERIRELSGDEGARLLIAGNSVGLSMRPDRALAQQDNPLIDTVELDPLVNPLLMDDAVLDVGVSDFRQQFGDRTGHGVRVAVLDSGIDGRHPFLRVADAVSTAGESTDIPGSHGTHCAGSIASRDLAFPGIAPDVTLINIKVLRANGSGRHTDITRGIDEALDREADILSMSLGFNHLPAWSDGGHGWSCPNGRCPLCTAVDNAAAFGALVIVAAGNEHERAERLRALGQGGTFDTEYGCPGQAREALTVAAVTKRTFIPAGFTSRGVTAHGGSKPDIAAPGVNIMSTIPVPRGPDGQPVAAPTRGDLFGRKSGTSMATPIVAGAAALIIEERRAQGLDTSPQQVRSDLLQRAVSPLPDPQSTVGNGIVALQRY